MNQDNFERWVDGKVYQVLEKIPYGIKLQLYQVTDAIFTSRENFPTGFDDNQIRSQIEVSFRKFTK